MPSPNLTRGPLPASVYWRRRALVGLLALTLVFGIGKLLTLGGGSDGGRAQLTGAPTTAGTADVAPTEKANGKASGKNAGNAKKAGKTKKSATPSLAVPVGVCADDDIAVTPNVEGAVAGRPVTITLDLQTLTTAACTWQVSPQHLTVKITSGSDSIWSTSQCPSAIPRKDVVVRQAQASQLTLTWGAARRNDSCSRIVQWALPGYYHVAAAALGGEPDDEQFYLAKPSAQVIKKTVAPKPKQSKKKHD